MFFNVQQRDRRIGELWDLSRRLSFRRSANLLAGLEGSREKMGQGYRLRAGRESAGAELSC
jgi:hypothetical protein